MSLNVSSANSILQNEYEENQPYCPKELQAKVIAETKVLTEKFGVAKEVGKIRRLFEFKTELKWKNIFFMTVVHVLAVYNLLTYPYSQQWKAFLRACIMGMISEIGVTAGAHRYWTHRSYKANVPVRIILMLCFCSSGQNSICEWVQYHRVHHKFSETDADPHNSNRGFFFSHVGWLLMKRHPEVVRRKREVDISDVLADPVVAFAEKYFSLLKILMTFVLPVVMSVYIWNDSWYYAIVLHCFMRYALTLNFTWSVNSFAHIWGQKPYDRNIASVENRIVSALAVGEGWHNYHHVFPWDYKAAELGNYSLNITTAVIDFFALLGWVTDRKQPSPELVQAIILNRGDRSHPIHLEAPMPEKKLY